MVVWDIEIERGCCVEGGRRRVNDEKQLKLKVFIKGFFFFKFFFLLFRLTMTQKFLDTVKSALGR